MRRVAGGGRGFRLCERLGGGGGCRGGSGLTVNVGREVLV